jgi:hypothetical protein
LAGRWLYAELSRGLGVILNLLLAFAGVFIAAVALYVAVTSGDSGSEDVPLAVELRDGDPVSELSQAGGAATSGAAVVTVV